MPVPKHGIPTIEECLNEEQLDPPWESMLETLALHRLQVEHAVRPDHRCPNACPSCREREQVDILAALVTAQQKEAELIDSIAFWAKTVKKRLDSQSKIMAALIKALQDGGVISVELGQPEGSDAEH